LQEAGEFGAGLPGASGHRLDPLGSEATPGVGRAMGSLALHVTLGPEAGHGELPAGSESRGESSIVFALPSHPWTGTVPVPSLHADATDSF